MKKIILSGILCMFLFQVNAQINNYYNRMQHVFGNIDETKVTTGFLKEFGIRFNNVEAYNGILDSTNYVDKIQWQSLYSSLYTMRVGSTATNMTATSSLFTQLKTAQQTSNTDVLLVLQHYEYQQYKSNALTNGDVTVSNDRIYDVIGRNPYDTKTVFAVAPLKKELLGDVFTFKLPSSLIYTNTNLTVSQIEIDFDNGQGYQIVTLNSDKSVSYTSGGVKELKYKITYSNSAIMFSHSKIWVDYVTPQNTQGRYPGFGSGIIRDTIVGNTWNGFSARGHITVKLASGHTQLSKPLIVIEGFDPYNSFDHNDFISGLFVDIDPNPLNFESLNSAIYSEGYDLVFVDYEDGTDYIQRNAYMVEEVIRWVNTEKNIGNNPDAEKNVVLGMSMGGLVARYALSNMEQNGETHDTKLYISHDTPHQGANVPVGFQAMVRHLKGETLKLPFFFSLFDFDFISVSSFIPGLNNGFDLLQSPAARQMISYQLDGEGDNVTVNNNALFTSFFNEYHSMGNPSQSGIRNIAIANGSECGHPLSFSDNATMLHLNDRTDLSYLENFGLGVFQLITWNPLKFISSVFSSKTDIVGQFIVKALPNQEVKQVYNGQIYISKTILWNITVHEPLIDEYNFNSQSTMLPLDNASGGTFSIDGLAQLPANVTNSVLEPKFSFIPSYSSLNIGGGTETIGYADLNKPYSPSAPPIAPKNVHFDNFYTDVTGNENHIHFNTENGNWLLKELKDSVAFISCPSACSNDLPLRIIGTNQVCINSSASYFLNNISSQATINWNISPPGGFTLTSNGSNATITPNGNFGGIAILSAVVTTSCNNSTFTISKEIQAGAERPILYDRNGNQIATLNFPTLQWENISFNTPPGTLEWEWNVQGNFSLQGGSNNYANVFSAQPTFGVLEVRRRDGCGWSPKTLLVLNFTNGQNGNFGFKAYPNPAQDILEVSRDGSENVNNDGNSSISLYDVRGSLVRKLNQATGELDLKGLRKGIYLLLIVDNNHIEKHSIVVE